MSTIRATVAGVSLAFAACGQALGQSLFLRAPRVAVNEEGALDPLGELKGASYFVVEPPEPRLFRTHDIVYIIVDEVTRASSSQTLERTRDFITNNQLRGVLDPAQLIEARLRAANVENLPLLDFQSRNQFTGDGEYDRTDRITARLAAKVIDVKPNGTLVLEASKSVSTDEESRVLILSGIARQEDITNANTILSSQLADLRFQLHHDGEVRDSAKRGLLTKVLNALFAF